MVTTIQCPCCFNVMFAIVQQNVDMAMRVHFTLQLAFHECPVCGEDMTDLMVFSPAVQGQAKIKGGPSGSNSLIQKARH